MSLQEVLAFLMLGAIATCVAWTSGYFYGLTRARDTYRNELHAKAEQLLRHSALIMNNVRSELEGELQISRLDSELEQLRQLINNLDLWFIRRFGAFIDDPRKK